MIELVSFDEIIKGYKDIPARYYQQFCSKFVFFHVGTSQEFFVTKVSVKNWLAHFSAARKANFRDIEYINHLLLKQSEFTIRDDKFLFFKDRYLHSAVYTPFEIQLELYEHSAKFREELIATKEDLNNKLAISTNAECVEINNEIAKYDVALARVNSILNSEKMAIIARFSAYNIA